MEPLPAPIQHQPPDLDQLLKNLTDPMNIIDRDFRVVWANDPDPEPGAIRLQVVGEICYRIFMDREEPCEECPIRAVFESGRPEVMEKRVRFDSGYLLHTQVWAYPIFEPDGSFNRVIKIGHPVGEGRAELATAGKEKDKDPASAAELSPRELEVLALLAQGLTNQEIAETLSISPHTVKTHVIGLFNKLGISKRTQAAVMAVRMGLI